MSVFLRLLSEDDKGSVLLDVCTKLRANGLDKRVFEVQPEAFDSVPGKPFAYWVSEAVRQTFRRLPAFEGGERTVKQGLATADDFRFVRIWWEINSNEHAQKWALFAKGGSFSPFYADLHLVLEWSKSGAVLKGKVIQEHGNVGKRIYNEEYFFRPGLTWPRRTQQFGIRVMPKGAIFADKGPACFESENKPQKLLSSLGLMLSRPFGALVELSLNAADTTARSYEVGIIQKTPLPNLTVDEQATVATLAHHAWSLKRTLDTVEETSHAFSLPAAVRARLGDFDPSTIEAELARIQTEIDDIAFDLYGFNEADRAAVQGTQAVDGDGDGDAEGSAADEGDDEDSAVPVDQTAGLLSWAVGVAFGRFDWRLATGERAAPAEPEPFDPLPAKSPGMLPDDATHFHAHASILVDDQGHPHDLARLVEEVLNRVDVSVPDDVRRWLRKDFFAFHLQRYSKSRRKAPIYWPLSIATGSYTLWVYYPSLNNQTLFTAVNDFLDGPNGKLTQVSRECAELRIKGGGRSRDEEKQYETLQIFEQELTDLRDILLEIAPTYQPNHGDGVQITAAPLWPLFRHKPWQKVLKDTWTKLEKGDYDWAHLSMAYWPERVREKCKADRSLAIAHGFEDLYAEPVAAPKKTRARKKAGGEE
jgi:hypothetical protein